jgi:hypothetical protein
VGQDRPLSEVITSPNLPLKSGFRPDEFDLELDESPSIQNQLSPAQLAALAKQFSSREKSSSRPSPLSPDTDLSAGGLAEPPRWAALEAGEIGFESPANLWALFDFASMRQQFFLPDSAAENSLAPAFQEIDYWNLRRQYDQADERLQKLTTAQLTAAQQWEVAWQGLQVAIGLRDPQRLEAARQQMEQLTPPDTATPSTTGLEGVYREYAAAHAYLLQPLPDYLAATESFQTVLRQLAERLSVAEGLGRQRMLLLLLDGHCQMARCVAMGPYQQAPASADLWYARARDLAEQMIRTQQAAPLIRTRVVWQQIEGYAEAGRFGEIQVLLNYLTTQEHQLRTQGQGDDSQWLRDQVTAGMLQAGLMALNYRQWALARTWAQQGAARLKAVQGQTEWRSRDQQRLATTYWLLGAIEYHSGQVAAAVPQFQQAMNLWADPSHGAPVDPLGHGERLAVAAVALWQHGQQPAAVQLGQQAVDWIQTAVERGIALPERIETPAGNLQEMIAALDSAFPALPERAAESDRAVEPVGAAQSRGASPVSAVVASTNLEQAAAGTQREIQAQLENAAIQSAILWEDDLQLELEDPPAVTPKASAGETPTAPRGPAIVPSPEQPESTPETAPRPVRPPRKINELRR